MTEFCDRAGLVLPRRDLPTFPSWQPQRAIDHILVSPGLEVRSAEVLDSTLSDHRPVAMTLQLPDGVSVQRHSERDQ